MVRTSGQSPRAFAAFLLVLQSLSLVSCASPLVLATDWDPRVIPAVKFVEKTYGRPFRTPVQVRFLDDAAFDRLTGISGGSYTRSHPIEAMLGIAEVDEETAFGESGSGTILAGLYQHTGKSLLVRGTKITEENMPTVVHELTHAMQDQYFSLTSLDGIGEDREIATLAVIEGDAVWVENRYRISRMQERADSESDTGAANEEAGEDTAGDATEPPELSEEERQFLAATGTAAFDFWASLMPYSTGWLYMELVHAAGGVAARDETMKAALNRRISTLDVMMLRVQKFSEPTPAPATSEEEPRQYIGAFRWFALLLGLNEDPRVVLDQVVTETSDASSPCATQIFRLGNSEASERLATALKPWMERNAVSPTQDEDLSLNWCLNTVVEDPSFTIEQLLAALDKDQYEAADLAYESLGYGG